jgi:hypothetical protein
LDKTVCQSRLAVVNVGDDAEIANVFHDTVLAGNRAMQQEAANGEANAVCRQGSCLLSEVEFSEVSDRTAQFIIRYPPPSIRLRRFS